MPTKELHAFMNQWTVSRDMALAKQAARAIHEGQVMFPSTVDQLSGVAHPTAIKSDELLAGAPARYGSLLTLPHLPS